MIIERARTFVQTLLRSKFVRDTITLQAGKMTLMVVNVVSFVIVARGLGTQQYGVYQLVLTMFGLLMAFNLTGLEPGTVTQMAEAIGARDRAQVRALMGFFLKLSLIVAVIALVVSLLGGRAFAEASYGNPLIGQLFQVYVLTLFLQPITSLALITLQSLRAMRSYTLLENSANAMEALLKIGFVLAGGGARGVIVAHVLAAGLKAGNSLILYHWSRRRHRDVLPGFGEILAAARHSSLRSRWQFGVLLAADKSIAHLYTLLPVQFLGMWGGETAAGFLRLGLGALAYPSVLFTGILTNVETRLPSDAGQRNYIRLADNFARLLRYVPLISVGVYGGFALVAPILVPLLGADYVPATPVIRVLCGMGVITGIGGVFGPLYRTLRLMRAMLLVKVVTLAVVALPGLWLINRHGALGGAWTVNLLYAVSVGLTVAIVLPRLRALARQQQESERGAIPAID